MSLLPPNKNPDVRLLDTIKELETELATLRAKAEAYDKGHECFGVFDASSQLATISAHPQDNLTNGYTCRKVRVCEVVE